MSKILPFARLIGVIHDSNGEPLVAKSLLQLVQNGRFTCPDVAVNDSQPALVADGILTLHLNPSQHTDTPVVKTQKLLGHHALAKCQAQMARAGEG